MEKRESGHVANVLSFIPPPLRPASSKAQSGTHLKRSGNLRLPRS